MQLNTNQPTSLETAIKETRQFFQAAGHQLYGQVLGEITPDKPTLIFLHGGLDCIDMWRGFPEKIVAATGLAALVYERWGHGSSDPLILPLPSDHRQREANGTLADVMNRFDLNDVILVGHSYGAALALLGAAYHPDRVRGAVSIAPQLTMHAVGLKGLNDAVAAYERGKLKHLLEKYHGDKTESLFRSWSSAALAPPHAATQYDRELATIRCPVQVVVGAQDVYGYQPNLDAIDEYMRPGVAHTVILPGLGHHPHWENPQAVIDAISPFIGELATQNKCGGNDPGITLD